MKNTIKLNESKLRKAISESIKKVLREGEFDTMDWDYAYGDAMGDMIKYSADKNKLKKKVAESVKGVLKEYGYDSHPESGYEPFKKIGEGAANWVMDKLKKEYANDVDTEAIEHIISEFGYSLRVLADVGDIDNGIKGFGIKS